jgi:hypothetical protein
MPPAAREGLCQALRAGNGDGPGDKQAAKSFEALVRAAGGPDRVDEFCADVAGGRPPGGRKADPPGARGGPAAPPSTTPPSQGRQPAPEVGRQPAPEGTARGDGVGAGPTGYGGDAA